ncbi:glycosyltransferase [Sphingomonas oleivorans]|nr:glycosyltransferase [Sphingomonas oleivorans]
MSARVAEAEEASRKLILVVAAYFPDSYGGAERQAKILAEALGRQGVDVTIVAPTIWTDTVLSEPAAFGRIERIRVKHYPNYGGRRIASLFRWTSEFYRRYGGEAFRGVPVYAFHARLHALAPALVASRLDSPLLIKLGGGGEASDFIALDEKRYFYGAWVKRLLLRRVDIFVANGIQIEKDLAALGVSTERIAAFPNGVQLPPLDEVKEAIGTRNGDRFVFTGRMISDKNVAMLYEGAEGLALAGRSFTFAFVGDGAERETLSARAEAAGVAGQFEFPGFASDVYPHLMPSDFFMSASLREGQSNSLLEAMSAGCIPILFAASGVEDVVRDGETGFVVRDISAAGLREAMVRALDLSVEKRMAMARAARRFAEDRVGIDATATRTIAALDKARERRGR